MPTYVLGVPEVHHASTRSIVKKLANEILDNFGIKPDETQIVIEGLSEVIPTNNSTMGSGDDVLRLNSDQRIEVGFEEEVVDPQRVIVLNNEQRPIFVDPDLRVWMKPVMVANKLTITFRLICKDRSSAAMWRRRAEKQSYRGMHQFVTDIDYHYAIPNGYMIQLLMIHKLRETSQVPLNESYQDWLDRCFTKSRTQITDRAGNQQHVAIAEKQTRVTSLIDFEHDVTQIRRGTDAGAWETEFTLTTWYDRVDDIVLHHPIAIHQQLIPKEYREDYPEGRQVTDWDSNRSLSLGYFGHFEGVRKSNTMQEKSAGIKFPYWDDWLHVHQPNYYVCMTRLLLSVLKEDPTLVMDVPKEMIGDYSIKDTAITYLKDVTEDALYPYNALFQITLHRWWELIDPKYIAIDNDLVIHTTKPMDLKNMYHLVFTVCNDLRQLTPDAIRKLKDHPRLVVDWMDTFWPDQKDNLIIHYDDPHDKNKGRVENLEDLIKKKQIDDRGYNVTFGYNRRLVNGFTILTRP